MGSILNWLFKTKERNTQMRRKIAFGGLGTLGKGLTAGDGCEASMLVAEPGDLLVMQYLKPVSRGMREEIMACIEEQMKLHPGVRIMVVDDSWRVVLAPKELQSGLSLGR